MTPGFTMGKQPSAEPSGNTRFTATSLAGSQCPGLAHYQEPGPVGRAPRPTEVGAGPAGVDGVFVRASWPGKQESWPKSRMQAELHEGQEKTLRQGFSSLHLLGQRHPCRAPRCSPHVLQDLLALVVVLLQPGPELGGRDHQQGLQRLSQRCLRQRNPRAAPGTRWQRQCRRGPRQALAYQSPFSLQQDVEQALGRSGDRAQPGQDAAPPHRVAIGSWPSDL